MKKAANKFSKDRLLGVVGYGEVYKGVLEDGTIVAIKCAKLGTPRVQIRGGAPFFFFFFFLYNLHKNKGSVCECHHLLALAASHGSSS
uniref:Uncharacterized protein n=1 Tax=Nelumbo nucifera TaxID=4432 RepID=A0A822Z4B5_NELNU|nr:TPA_asm: hypothetical protein HUJ06_013803 [Nelumbo nucifera]